jgi:hypothetical protein
MISLVGIFVYIFLMSKEASLRLWSYGISLRSVIRWVVFFTFALGIPECTVYLKNLGPVLWRA